MKKNLFLVASLLLILALSLAACGGSSQQSSQSSGGAQAQASQPEQAPAGDPAAGKEKFGVTCVACHGPAGEGVPGLGKDMTTSEFIAGKTDTELVEFIKVGRDPSDPLNTTGVAMPPKGGNPALNDQDLYNLVAFIRILQK
jgi:disulfide bond formation protein DsbB